MSESVNPTKKSCSSGNVLIWILAASLVLRNLCNSLDTEVNEEYVRVDRYPFISSTEVPTVACNSSFTEETFVDKVFKSNLKFSMALANFFKLFSPSGIVVWSESPQIALSAVFLPSIS